AEVQTLVVVDEYLLGPQQSTKRKKLTRSHVTTLMANGSVTREALCIVALPVSQSKRARVASSMGGKTPHTFTGDGNQEPSRVPSLLVSHCFSTKTCHHKGSRRWHFASHNASLSLYWFPFLVQGVQRTSTGPQHDVMHLDLVNEKWARDVDQMDLIVLSVGNWFLFPSVFYEGGKVLGCLKCHGLKYNDVGFYGPLRKALRIALNSIIERKVGDWDKGRGYSKTKPYRKEMQLGEVDAEIRRIEKEEVENAKAKVKQFGGFRLEALDVTKLALLRPDGHPGAYMNPFPFANGVPKCVQSDCVHWCLPWPINSWNKIFLEMMKKWEKQPRSQNDEFLLLIYYTNIFPPQVIFLLVEY
ncbi:Protein ALTERED XYLOGLUCAN 4, partial [Glycine soja]